MRKIYLVLVLAHGMASHGANVADLAVIRTKYKTGVHGFEEEGTVLLDKEITLQNVQKALNRELELEQVGSLDKGFYTSIRSGNTDIQSHLKDINQRNRKLNEMPVESFVTDISKQALEVFFYDKQGDSKQLKTNYYYYNKDEVEARKANVQDYQDEINLLKNHKSTSDNTIKTLNTDKNSLENQVKTLQALVDKRDLNPLVWIGLVVSLLCNIYLLYQDEDEDEEPKPSKTSKLAKRAKTSKLAKQTQRATPRPAKEKQAKP